MFQSYAQLQPEIREQSTGSRIRLDISSSNFPAYHVHPNIAGNWAEMKEVRTAVQTLYWGGDYDSAFELPVATEERE
jgi:uncharacterized protein